MSQSSDITTKLRDMILSMEVGPGEQLTERGAEAYFNASRTPIRTAFQKLEAEGLLQREGKRWIVTPIKIEELEQLYYYREILEIAAMKCGAQNFTDDNIRSLERVLDTPLTSESQNIYEDVGTQFHLKLASFCGNKYIIAGLEDVLRQLYRVRWLEMSPDNPAINDHSKIITALLNKDVNKASELLAMHLQEGCKRLIKSVSANKRSLRARGIAIK